MFIKITGYNDKKEMLVQVSQIICLFTTEDGITALNVIGNSHIVVAESYEETKQQIIAITDQSHL